MKLRFILARIVITTILSIFLAATGKAESFADKQAKVRDSFKHYEGFAKAIGRCNKVVLHEGLPHQTWEREKLESELKNKKTEKIGGFPFYAETLSLNDEDAKLLQELYCTATSFTPFAGAKRCGGYHPDYCIEWSDGKRTYYVQFCFGCHEMKTFEGNTELYCDVETKAFEKFKEILSKYRKQRPKEREL